MILRRVTEHVKAQNWFAVAIDFLIVVVGVFIGIQVANWNAARAVREGEKAYMLRWVDYVGSDIEALRRKTEYFDAVAAAGRRSLEFIADGHECRQDCRGRLVDFFIASQWRDLTSRNGVLGDIHGSPYPYDEALKQKLINFYSELEQSAVVASQPQYRTLVRSLIPVDAQSALWANCHQGGGDNQRIITDCAAALPEDEAATIVNRLAANGDIEQTLTFYASTVASLTPVLRAQISTGDEIIASLRERLEAQQ
jgi:hypothetical protein